MGMLRSAFREMRDADFSGFGPSWRIPSNSEVGGGGSWAGVAVTERSALQLLTVWSCVSLISDTISTLPVGAFRKKGAAREAVTPSPLLVEKPHAEYDVQRWVAELLVSLLIRGNGYGWIIERDKLGYASQVMPLHPSDVEPERGLTDGKITYRISGVKSAVPAIDMMHVRGLSFPGPLNLKGLSPIDYARHAIGLGLAAQEFGSRWFSEGTHPSAVLETDKQLDETAAKRVLKNFIKAHSQRNRTPALLTHGLKYRPISITPEESQFLQTRTFSRTELAGFYRVPPHMVGAMEKTSSWGTGIEELALQLISYTLQPWIVRMESAMSQMLPRGQYVKFNIAGLLRGRLIDRYQAFRLGREGGWLSIDDIRALDEMPPLPEGKGQDHLQPLNYAPIPPGGGAPAVQEPPAAPVTDGGE